MDILIILFIILLLKYFKNRNKNRIVKNFISKKDALYKTVTGDITVILFKAI